jgi:butyryl-CoA dehydrogenase
VRDFTDRVAVVTGAASGIGRALSLALARRGAHVALVDRNEPGLAAVAGEVAALGRKASRHVADVADRARMEALPDEVLREHGRVSFLANNAGVSVAGAFEEQSLDDFAWIVGINFWGVVHGTKAFLPHLKAAGEGHIVNVSSVFGLVSVPSQSAYNAAKFAVRGFTDALRMELEVDPCGVSCTTVHPGGVKTNIVRTARIHENAADLAGDADLSTQFEKVALTSPDKAARQILAAVQADRRRTLVGPDAKVIDLIARLPARLYQRLLVRGASRRTG